MENKINTSVLINVEEFEQRQEKFFKKVLDESLARFEKKDTDDTFLTRKQVADRLHISLPTLNSLTKDGSIIGYRLKGRVLYKEADINRALVKIESIKYRRSQ